jgi:hypothetical protein
VARGELGEVGDLFRAELPGLSGEPVGELCAGDEVDPVSAGVLLREPGPQDGAS